MANPNLIEVVDALCADLREIPGVRKVTTEHFTPTAIPASEIPIIGVYEEQLEEKHKIGRVRRCTLTLRLDCLVQGEDEERSRELRDELRNAINLFTQADTRMGGWAQHTDEASQWVYSTLEDPRMLQLERLIKIFWDEDCGER